MASVEDLEAKSKKDEPNVKITKNVSLEIEAATGVSNLMSTESYDLSNAFKDLDSYSKSLALLQCLSNFDSNRSAQKDRLENFPTCSGRETSANLTEYFGSSSASINTACSRDESPVSSIIQEQPKGDFQVSTSLTHSLNSSILTRPPDQIDLAEKQNNRSNQTDSEVDKISCTTSQENSNRRRNSTSDEDTDQLVRELGIWGPPDTEEGGNNATYGQSYPNNCNFTSNLELDNISEPRLARIHSAAALFRRPSAASKKHTRPPMSRIFISLDITAEMFLKLQGAAKRFMLDERYPERRKAIGTKCQAENEHKKLKLFSLVKHFLDVEGWGERCFGSKAEGADLRKLKWPESKNIIIKRVTPLMRRMVTNERQRQYANERRMEKRTKNSQERKSCRKDTPSLEMSGRRETDERSSNHQTIQTADGPSLPQSTQDSISDFSSLEIRDDSGRETLPPISQLQVDEDITQNVESGQLLRTEKKNIKYYINLLRCNRRVKEQLIISSSRSLNFSGLIHHMTQLTGPLQKDLFNIKVLGPDGLIEVDDEDSWAQAILLIFKHEWMDQEVRCLVNSKTSIQKLHP
ncbi:hypothetical protein GcC1_080010 [Golovinomyces cichoracearum]|uniref:Uncharacterized protein n=1 Tax=Golovinomyces cichoracearum TaxID=62708 RepID=A0A420IL02_9PEZI|nr:hypothetical protein GcC1_080010 [Golovinomyces cichoracearum]